MRYLPIAAVVVCLCACSALAQSTSPAPYPNLEIFGGYSANGSIKSDEERGAFNSIQFFNDNAGGPNGFEASITRNFNKYLGIKGDFSMYFGSNAGHVTVQICSQSSCEPAFESAFSISRRAYYFMAGPEIKWRNKTRLTPFAHTLFGVARSTAEFKNTGAPITHISSDGRTGFAAALGGGLDIRLTKRFSIRTMMDYTAAFLEDTNAGASGRQNRVRLSIGIVFGK